ncbi:hypothetical protein D8T52_12430, partial [Vibrio vulnificus]
FLQTPPLASDALAIRIVFPLVRVTPFSFKWTGLPALLGKQQRTRFKPGSHKDRSRGSGKHNRPTQNSAKWHDCRGSSSPHRK